jgi:hypothetical protein
MPKPAPPFVAPAGSGDEAPAAREAALGRLLAAAEEEAEQGRAAAAAERAGDEAPAASEAAEAAERAGEDLGVTAAAAVHTTAIVKRISDLWPAQLAAGGQHSRCRCLWSIPHPLEGLPPPALS